MLILRVLAGRWKSYRGIQPEKRPKVDPDQGRRYVLAMLISLFVVVMETSPKVGNEAK